MMILDSSSPGDPARFLALEPLRGGLAQLPPAPADGGTVALVVVRGERGARTTPDQILLDPERGVVGDSWGRQADRELDAQIAVMQAGVASLIANGQPLALFGDSLFLDLDLSESNLPPGTTLRVGSALLIVTPEPHTGCRKFRNRFGGDALRLVSDPGLSHRKLRGIYMRVLEAGTAAPGDRVAVVSRCAG